MAAQKQQTLMNQAELEQFNLHAQDLMFDTSDHSTKFRIFQTKDRVPYLRALPYNEPSKRSQQAVSFINLMIYRGLVDVNQEDLGQPSIKPKLNNPNLPARQERPMAWMNVQETEEFDQALETVQRHQRRGNCRFDSWLDDNLNLYTRTSVTERAPEDDVETISNALQIVSNRLHDGTAVRVPMPEGSIMYMARFSLTKTFKL